MLLFYNWPFPHVYFAKNTAYFPFNSWLSFQRLCRLSWGLLSLQWSTQLLCKQCMCYAQLTDCAALSMDSSIVQWPNDRACNIRYITRPTLQRLTLSGQSSHEHEWLWQSLICQSSCSFSCSFYRLWHIVFFIPSGAISCNNEWCLILV